MLLENFGLRDVIFISFCALIHLVYRYRRRTKLPLPPGLLPRWPFVGNALAIPLTSQHKFFKELGKKLGSKIFYLEAFDQSMVIINDVKIAQDLLDKRSALYSSRPRPRMLADVMKVDYIFPFMPYGEKWRIHRRIFQQYFSSKNLDKELERTTEFIRKGLLTNLYEEPKNFSDHILSCMGGLITASVYGIPIKRTQDPMVELQEYIFGVTEGAATPGRFLIDIIPWLKYVPSWFPGAGFKTLASDWVALLSKAIDLPYEATVKGMDDGTTRECLVSWSLEQCRDQYNFEDQALRVKHTAGAIYKAGTDTRTSTSLTFILAMLLHPEVQRKAQAEVDSVVGHDRLPDFCDRAHLPYLSAVLKEVLRWNPALPLGIPHLTSDEDVYETCYIPKGTVVFANTYAMLHDEQTFPNPEDFDPERFIKNGKINPDILDPETVATFGFGRRVCPGAHIAMSTLYLVVASILALFDITPELDSEGKPIDVSPTFSGTSIISQPLPFSCSITPRQGKNVEGLLKEYMGFDII